MNPSLRGAGISGIGMCVPEKILTNSDLEKIVETSDEWIFSRTGIRERRVAAENESTGDFATGAAREAMAVAGLNPEDVDLLLVATCTGDTNALPATATWVQEKLGAWNAAAYDLSAACAGFAYAVDAAHQYLATGRYKNVLVIGAETMTRIVDWTDRNTCVLFGDGAGAIVMTPCEPGDGVLSSVTGADGRGACKLYVPGAGTRDPKGSPYLYMEGKDVYRFAVEIMGEAAVQALDKAGITPEQVDLFVPHQANIRIIEAAAKRMNLPPEKVFVNVEKYGNTSAASIPIAMYEAWKSGLLKPGDIIVSVGFGAGLTWGANVIKWGNLPAAVADSGETTS
ncbi:MAG: beta-ketoacyl-ACP synthase III [Armatimonas sp.]